MENDTQVSEEIEGQPTETTTPENKGTEVQESTSIIKEANQAAERLEKATKEMKEAAKKLEDLRVESQFGGRSAGGQSVIQETADQKWAREAKLRYAGTGMDPTN